MTKIILVLLFASDLQAQTTIGPLDGTAGSAPSNPSAGRYRMYFKTGTGICQRDSAGTETCIGSGSGATAISGLTDLKVTIAGNVATLATGKIPCGSVIYTVPATTFTLSSGTATSYIGFDCAQAGVLPVTLARGANVMSGVSGYTDTNSVNLSTSIFPNIIPIASITAAAGPTWTAVTDLRTLGSWAGGLAAGTGTTISYNADGLPQVNSTASGGIAPWTRAATMASRPTCDGTREGQGFVSDDGIGLESKCFSSVWSDYYRGGKITRTTVAAASWTAVNSPTVADANGFVVLSKATTGLGLALVTQADTAWTVTAGFLMPLAKTDGHECGIYATTGTTAGTHIASGFNVGVSAAGPKLLTRQYNPINGAIGNAGLALDAATLPITGGVVWLRIARSGLNFTYFYGDGPDGTWNNLGTGTHLLAGTPTHLGFGCDPRGTVPVSAKLIHWVVQ